MKLGFQRSRDTSLATAPTLADFPQLSGADIAGMVQGERVGGDLYHFLRANRCRVIFGLLDVAGRSEENQKIVDAARATFQELGCEKFVDEEVNEADAMMEFCLELNLSIRRAAAGVRSCAAFLGCYNEELGTICYVNAGHTPGLLRDPFRDHGIAGDGSAARPVRCVHVRGAHGSTAIWSIAVAGLARRGGSGCEERRVRARTRQTSLLNRTG